MQILTPSGYRDIADCAIGDEVSAFDIATGAPINTIETLQWVDAAEWARWWQVEPSAPPFQFFKINDTWTLNSEQSIWRNGGNVCHAKHLVVGDVIYDDADHDVTITSIEEVTADGWWRLDISGDHSYIVDGLTVHNASRFWVGGTGTWDSSTTTHWAAITGSTGGQSVPGSADSVTFDASSGGGTVTPNFGGTITIQSLTAGTFTGTLDFSANNNDVTLGASGLAFNINGTSARTINLGNGTWTVTATVGGSNIWQANTITNLTFNANGSSVNFTGSSASGAVRTIQQGALTYNNFTFSGAGSYSFTSGANTTLNALTIGAGVNFAPIGGQTLTVTSLAVNGSSASPSSLMSSSIASSATISCASGTQSLNWTALRDITFSGGATFNATNSFDLGHNSGGTMMGPSGGGFFGVIGS